MKRAVLPAVAGAFLALAIAATPAMAGSYLNEAATAVSSGQVFAPGNPAAQGQIQPQLDGHIAVAVLPASAASQVGSAASFATALDAATHHRFVVITEVGPDIGYASRLMPTTDLAAQLANAKNQAQDPVQQVVSFIGDVEQIEPSALATAPKAEPTGKASKQGQSGGTSPLVIILPILLILVGVGLLVTRRLRKNAADPYDRQRVPDPPGSLPDSIHKLRRLIPSVRDEAAKAQLEQVCERIPALFDTLNRYAGAQQVRLATDDYEDQLPRYINVVDAFIRFCHHPDYWPGSRQANMRSFENSIASFNADVLHAIQRANEGVLLRVQVDQRILQSDPGSY